LLLLLAKIKISTNAFLFWLICLKLSAHHSSFVGPFDLMGMAAESRFFLRCMFRTHTKQRTKKKKTQQDNVRPKEILARSQISMASFASIAREQETKQQQKS
jgi:hypothetical protein